MVPPYHSSTYTVHRNKECAVQSMKATAHDRKEVKSTPMRAEKHMHSRVKHSLALSIQIKTEMSQPLFVKFSNFFFPPMALRPDSGPWPPLTGLRDHTPSHTILDRAPLDE